MTTSGEYHIVCKSLLLRRENQVLDNVFCHTYIYMNKTMANTGLTKQLKVYFKKFNLKSNG